MIRASIAQTEPSLLLLLTLGANVETVDINVQNGRKVSDCQIAGDDKNDRFISVIYQGGHSVNVLGIEQLIYIDDDKQRVVPAKYKWQRLKHSFRLNGLIWHSSARQLITTCIDGIHRLWMLNGHQFTNQLAINTFEWLAYQPTPLPVPQELECLPNIYPVLSDSAAGTLHWLDCHSMRRLAAQSQMKELNSEIFQFYSEILLAVLADGSLVIWGIQENQSGKRHSPRLFAISYNSRLFDYRQTLQFSHRSKSLFRNTCSDLVPRLFPGSVIHIQIETALESLVYAIDIRLMSPNYTTRPLPLLCDRKYLHLTPILHSMAYGRRLMTVHATDGGRLIALWDLMGNSEFSDNYLLEPTRRSQFKISGNEKIFWLGENWLLVGRDLRYIKGDSTVIQVSKLPTDFTDVIDAAALNDSSAAILFSDGSVVVICLNENDGELQIRLISQCDGAVRLLISVDRLVVLFCHDNRLVLMDADTTTIFHTTSISPEGDKITQLKCADKWLACVIENGATGDQVLKWYSVNRLSQEIQFQATHVISKKERLLSIEITLFSPDRPLISLSYAHRTELIVPNGGKFRMINECLHDKSAYFIGAHLSPDDMLTLVYETRVACLGQLCVDAPKYCPSRTYIAAISTGPLIDYAPSLLTHLMCWEEGLKCVRAILMRLASFCCALQDNYQTNFIFPPMPIATLLVALEGDAQSEMALTEDLFHSDSTKQELETLTATQADAIKTKVSELPRITDAERSRLCSVVDIFMAVEKRRESLDANAIRFFVAAWESNSGHTLRKSVLSLRFRDYFWAYHSDSQSALLDLCTSLMLVQSAFGWEELRPLGPAFWVRSLDALKQLTETMARNLYLTSDLNNPAARSPTSAGLFYLALGKKKTLLALWKTSSAHPEHSKMVKFLSNDFSEGHWRIAARKNAFALLGLQRFREAATFFLLADCLWDAVQVCVKQMQDIQLAFLLVRLYLNDRGLFEDKKAAIYGVRTEDFKSDDYIKRLLWDHAIEQSRIEGDRWMLSLIFCWLQSPWESFVSLFDWPEQLSNELSAPSAPQEPELFIAYEILMDKIDKRKVSPPQKLTGPTADSFRIWQQQLIEKQIRFFFGIIAGAESKGFHVTLLSLLDKMAVLVTSQRFTRIYQSASVARRLPALTSAGKSINSGIIHWEDFSEQLEKPNALIMGTARSLFDDEGDDDLLGSQRKMKPISLFDDYDATYTSKTVLLFDDGPEHKIMLNNDGSRCGSSSSGYPDQPFLEASANKILSYKHHIGESLIPHIADTLIIDCVNPPALKSLRPFSGDENGIKNSLILVDKLLSSASETKDLYKRLGQLLSGFLFPLNIQQVPTEMMDSSMQTVLSCIFATVTDFEKECDQEMQHYHGYLDMICRRIFCSSNENGRDAVLIYLILAVSAIRSNNCQRILVAFQGYQEFTELLSGPLPRNGQKVVDRLFGRLPITISSLTESEQTIDEFELEHNQTTSELLSFSLCIACYEAVLQMLEHWLETIKCVNSLSLAEQLGRPIANQIEKQSRRWQNMLFSSKPPLLKINPVELLPSVDERLLWRWMVQTGRRTLRMHRFFDRQDRLIISEAEFREMHSLRSESGGGGGKSNLPKFLQRLTSHNSKSAPIISI